MLLFIDQYCCNILPQIRFSDEGFLKKQPSPTSLKYIFLCHYLNFLFRLPDNCHHSTMHDLLKSCVTLQVKMPAQLEAAFSFFSAAGQEDIKLNDFEDACGVGMIILLVIWFDTLVGVRTYYWFLFVVLFYKLIP